jgi:ATP-dependent RNA helicase DeaD
LDAILQATPETRQTTLFSATIPPRIAAIARRHLKDAQRVTVAHEKAVAGKLPRVRQIAYVVRRDQKADALGRVLDVESPASALVFCRTRVEVDALVEILNSHGYRAAALHGGLAQRQRDAVMARFRAGKSDLLIATDVAARGLDIKNLSHVVNYDLPASSEAYVHRIGRTGRAGGEGTAITFVEPRERRHLHTIEQVTHQSVEVAAIPTVADLRARRLEQTRTALRERLLAGDLDAARGVVSSLAGEFDALDVAAAAIQLLHAASGEEREEREIAPPPPEREPGRPPHARRKGGDKGAGAGKSVRLYVGAGHRAGIRPGDLVGAIAGESGVPSRELGAIEIEENFSLVEVPEARLDEIIAAMKRTTLRGRKVVVRLFREVG